MDERSVDRQTTVRILRQMECGKMSSAPEVCANTCPEKVPGVSLLATQDHLMWQYRLPYTFQSEKWPADGKLHHCLIRTMPTILINHIISRLQHGEWAARVWNSTSVRLVLMQFILLSVALYSLSHCSSTDEWIDISAFWTLAGLCIWESSVHCQKGITITMTLRNTFGLRSHPVSGNGKQAPIWCHRRFTPLLFLYLPRSQR